MTCHVGIRAGRLAALISDSQGSAGDTRAVGCQKQLVGCDYILGAAGDGAVIEDLFDSIAREPSTYAEIEARVVEYLETEVRDGVREGVEFLLQTPASLRWYDPRCFRGFKSTGALHAIGTGAEHVEAAWRRDDEIGVSRSADRMSTLLLTLEELMLAAGASLTVDSHYMLSILSEGRTYVLADRAISMQKWVPASITQAPERVHASYHELLAYAQTIRGELREAHRVFSRVRAGQLDELCLGELRRSNEEMSRHLDMLDAMVLRYTSWYDSNLGR